MNINVVIPSFYPAVVYGGTIFSSYYTCKELAKLGHQVKVSTTDTNMHNHLAVETNRFMPLDQNLKVKYYHDTVLSRFSLPLYVGLPKDIAAADVVHVQAIFNSPTPWALFQSYRQQKPVLLSPRGVLCDWIMNQGIRFKKQWLDILIRPFAHRIYWHATSEQEKNDILRFLPAAHVFIIPNGIDADVFANPSNDDRNTYLQKFTHTTQHHGPLIVSMGRIHPKKGFDILIHSFHKILSDYPSALLLIAGGDEGEQGKLEILVENLGLQNQARFIGSISGQDKVDFLAYADIFVLPSHNENFGNVYAEALAAGTPIVASTHTPWEEVDKYGCGRWVDNTMESTAQAMLDLLEGDLHRMSENAKSYSKRYSWASIAKQFEETFEQMLHEQNKPHLRPTHLQ